jgi:hypothetical protein
MCRSFETSVLTALYSYSIALVLWFRNRAIDRQFALVIAVFSTIQTLEAAIWWAIDHQSDAVNRAATTLIPVVLALELLTSLLVMSRHVTPTTLELAIYLSAAFLLVFLWFRTSKPTSSVDPVTKSLLWGQEGIDWLPRVAFLVLLVYPLLVLPLRSDSPGVNGLQIFSLGVTATFLYSFRYGETFGSNWCWISNALSTYALIQPH